MTVDGEFRLVINKIGLEDAGKYTCECDDKLTSAWLTVEGKKASYFFTQKLLKHMKVRQKKDIVLECMLSDPRPHVSWTKSGEPLEVSRQ